MLEKERFADLQFIHKYKFELLLVLYFLHYQFIDEDSSHDAIVKQEVFGVYRHLEHLHFVHVIHGQWWVRWLELVDVAEEVIDLLSRLHFGFG